MPPPPSAARPTSSSPSQLVMDEASAPSPTAAPRRPVWLARLALPLLLPLLVLLLWVESDPLAAPDRVERGVSSSSESSSSAAALRTHHHWGYQPQAIMTTTSSMQQEQQQQQRERLLAAIEGMEAALAADDERRALRAAGGGRGGEAGLGSYYDAAVAVPAGVIYPEGAPAAAGAKKGNRSANSLAPLAQEEQHSDALFRATVEALLLAATAGGGGDPHASNRTYYVVLRGASVSAGDLMVGVHGRALLHQEQATALLNAAFAGTPVRWRLIDMAKGNTESSDSLATFNLFDPTVPFESVRLLLWEHSVNDERNLKKPEIFERWIRTYLHWYPNADVGFIFLPGWYGPLPDFNATGVELVAVSDMEREYRKIIQHYAPPAGHRQQHNQHPRSLFLTSLGPLIEKSNRRFDAFYRQPPKNPHPGTLGYEAMGDMLAWHVKSRIRAALACTRSAALTADDSTTTTTLFTSLRRAAGLLEEEQPSSSSSSMWLSLPRKPWSNRRAEEEEEEEVAAVALISDEVSWLYRPPSEDGPEWAAMTNATLMATTVKLFQPSPNGRDLEGVTVECRRADGTTTWEPGMVFALERLWKETGCANLEGIGEAGVHTPGRVDQEVKMNLPPCNATDRSYTLRLPFGFARFTGPVLWPPGGLGLYLNGAPVFRDPDTPQNAPAWSFEPPVAPGATLRLCWNLTELAGDKVVLHNALSFT